MAELFIAGVKRTEKFSPNHIGNDAAIFNETVRHLQELGFRVNIYSENDFLESNISEPVVFSMIRDKGAIRKAIQLESDGCIVVNSASGIENCTRERMTRLLINNSVPHPRSIIVDTSDDIIPMLDQDIFVPCWIKRGDFHAIHREDVSYVRNAEEAQSILKEYAHRGIRTAVINEHLAGDLIKFYGVTGTDFFYWFYPFNSNHSKFGLEAINGEARGLSFDENELRRICRHASDVLNVRIYGGDCIVGNDGSIKIIDFNDWPSFAPCRNEAAPHIAECIAAVAAGKLNINLSNVLTENGGK